MVLLWHDGARLRNSCTYYYSIVWSRLSASYCHNFWTILWDLFRLSFRLTPEISFCSFSSGLAYRIIPSRLLHFINVRAVAWLPHNAAQSRRLDFMDPVFLGSVRLGLATVGAQDLSAGRLRYRALENVWWLPKDCQLFLRWMFHERWMTAGWLSDDCLMVPWQSPDDWFKTG